MKNSIMRIRVPIFLLLLIFILSCSKLSLRPQVATNPTLTKTSDSPSTETSHSPSVEDVIVFTAFSEGWIERYIYVAKIDSKNEIEISKLPQDILISWP